MERAEEVGASEGLNDLLCVQKSGSSPTATQTLGRNQLAVFVFSAFISKCLFWFLLVNDHLLPR